LILGSVFFFFIVSSSWTAVWYVPDNYTTIQDAIDAASNGDRIVVRPGTYLEGIDFLGKGITVQSESGPEVTTIDRNHGESVVLFSSGEGPDSVLDGFTLTRGGGTYVQYSQWFVGEGYVGGGIYCWASSPTIVNNIITENVAGKG